MYERRHKAETFRPAASAKAPRPAKPYSTTEPRTVKSCSKTFLFFNFALAALVGIAAGMPLGLQADDTEIYLGDSSLSTGVRPNVLFSLDTSGSMSGLDGGSIDRLDRMKNALYQILDDVNNINVGLMRFSDPGGPILFPVSYIDEDVSVIEGKGATASGMDINVQIAASNDDAEELKTDGSVDVASKTLEIMETGSGSSTTLLQRQVSSDPDNAEEKDDGDLDTNDKIKLRDSQNNGFRFRNITIPATATILDARLIFTAKDNEISSITLEVDGEASANSAGFNEGCNGCYDVSTRTYNRAHPLDVTVPEGVVSTAACALAEGSGLLYAINVLNGAAVYPNWDDVGDDSNLTKADRTYTLGGGGGATTIDPNLALPRQRTYWGQEE